LNCGSCWLGFIESSRFLRFWEWWWRPCLPLIAYKAISWLSCILSPLGYHTKRQVILLEHPHRAQYVTLQKYFWHPSLVISLFCNPTHKIETGTANRWGTLIANHLNQSLWLANQKHGATVRSYLLYSSLAGAQLFLQFLPTSANWANMQEKNHFPGPNRHMLTFLHQIIMCRVTYRAPLGCSYMVMNYKLLYNFWSEIVFKLVVCA